MLPYLVSSGLIALAGAALTGTFIINLCDWIFDCGCRSWWNGAVDMCNIHNAHPPHCPWCANGEGFFQAILWGILAPQVALAFTPRNLAWYWRLAAVLAAFPLVGWMLGLASGWWFGYWHG